MGSPPVETIRSRHRLGFAESVNVALARENRGATRIACLNDDAEPPPDWLGRMTQALESDPRLGAVQGTVTTASGDIVDGRGITFDPFGLPVHVDRGLPLGEEDVVIRQRVAVSATACLYRGEALHQVSIPPDMVFDSSFGSYHEDLDIGLRLRRLGWTSAWVGGAPTRHAHSTTGLTLRWRHPWWLLANRWRALAGNLTRTALLGRLPILLRGELRAIRTLLRTNPRTALVAIAVAVVLPALVVRSWRRRTPGPRLATMPDL
jgi:GT2 family glycosyltransferase